MQKSFQMRPSGWFFPTGKCASRIGKSIGTRGSRTSFETWESKIFMHSVPFPSLGIEGAVCFEMSYLIVLLLFRWKFESNFLTLTVLTVVFLVPPILLLYYITIYILISYIVFRKGVYPLIFNCKNCNCKIFRFWLLTYYSSIKPATKRSSSAASRQKSLKV